MEQKISRILSLSFYIELLVSLGVILYTGFHAMEPSRKVSPIQITLFQSEFFRTVIIFWLLLLMAIGFIIFAVLTGKNLLVYNRSLFLNLALFILLAAVWLFVESRVPSMLGYRQDVVRLCAYFAFHLLPVPFLFFVRGICIHGKRTFTLLTALFISSFVVNFVWLLLLDFAFPPTLFLIHVLIALSVAAFVVVSFLELFRYQNKNITEALIGVVILGSLSAGELVRYYVSTNKDTWLIELGLFAFILFLAFGTARRVVSGFSKARSFETIADSIPGGIFRAKNDEHMTITYANVAYYKIYGYASEDEAKKAGMHSVDFALEKAEADGVQSLCKKQIAAGVCRFNIEVREHDRDGHMIWVLKRLHYHAETDELFGTMIDITDRKQMEERLRISEEEYRIAVAQSDKHILRYDIKEKTIYYQRSVEDAFGVEECIQNIPEGALSRGMIAPESVESYIAFYEAIQRGDERGQMTARMMDASKGDYSWYHVDFTTIFDDSGQPQHSIISFYDVTEQREKELAYKRMHQELAHVPPEKISTFECNLTRDTTDRMDGKLLQDLDGDKDLAFNDRTARRVSQIYPEDQQQYVGFMNRERLLDDFEKGIYSQEFDYRRMISGSDYKWVRAIVQLVRYPDSNEIKAFVVVRDIDETKRAELSMRQLSQTDPLTHAFNRTTFGESVNMLLQNSAATAQHALIMIDLDHFKQINDTFGHMEGDYVLTSTVRNLKSLLREWDMIGRMGGDEFMICLRDIPFEDVVEKRVQLICQILCSGIDSRISVSASIGIAMYPHDGQSFEELYHKADIAMYQAKARGRNQYAFYHAGMHDPKKEKGATPMDRITDTHSERLDHLKCAKILQKSRLLQEAHENAERFHLMMEAFGVGIFEWNLETGVFYKDAVLDEYRLDLQEILKFFEDRAHLDCVHPDDENVLRENLWEPLKSGARQAKVTLRLKKVDGSYELCRLGILLMRDQDGKLRRVIGTILKAK